MQRVILGVLLLLVGACDSGAGSGDAGEVGYDWSWGSVDTRGPGVDTRGPGADTLADSSVDEVVTFPLVPGDHVPDFSLQAHSGAAISLADYSDDKTMVLSFFPTAAQGLSQQQIENLEARYGEIRNLGAFPFGVSMEDELTLAHWADDLALSSLLLLTDTDGDVATMFGVENNGTHYLQRGDVIISPDGKVKTILLYDAKESADIQAVLDALE